MCGIFGVFSARENSAPIAETIEGLKLLQHRGKDGCGIAYVSNGEVPINHNVFKELGSVKDVLGNFESKRSFMCIGHTRYSTSGASITSSINT